MITTTYKSPLQKTVSATLTDMWNDSCSVEELTYSIEQGAVGATTNPSIVLSVLNQEWHLWEDRLRQIIDENPTWSEIDVTWQIFKEVAAKGAELLLPIFRREGGLKGRLSIQIDPTLYRNAGVMADQAEAFSRLAPNVQVKLPVTKAGVAAIEEATFRGVNVNATVCFTVPQAIAVAEAVERGLERREAAGNDTTEMTPVCTIMVGRADDWLQVVAKRDGIVTNPGYLHWAGVAIMKKAYGIYQERGYRTRLLAAAYRHHLHWSELTGGNIILTIPYKWQKLFNNSDIEVKDRMGDPVDQKIVDELYRLFPDFRRAYDVDGLTLEEFDSYGASVRTLRGFVKSFHDLVGVVRDVMLPNPDVKA